MEVHHHSHTARKKWTHYFWEFFMLFLAVTAGFLVENQREHYIENKREKEYIKSLVEDIRLDIRDIDINITIQSALIKRIDSLFEILKSGNWKNQTSDIYFLIRRSTRTRDFYYHDRTIQQMKNSGAFRLIHNVEISNEIMNYEAEIKKMLALQTQLNDFKSQVRDRAVLIFDPLVIHSMVYETNDDVLISKPTGNPPLKRPDLLDETLGYLHYMRSLSGASNRLQLKIISAGTDLITLLKKEYNLRDR